MKLIHSLYAFGLLWAGYPRAAARPSTSAGLISWHGARFPSLNTREFQNAPIPLTNFGNNFYTTNIGVLGKEIPVAITTAHSDMWLFSSEVVNSNTTAIHAELDYGNSLVSGTIAFVNITVGPFVNVTSAFVRVDDAINMTELFDNGVYGVLGLGFENASVIQEILDENKYDATLRPHSFASSLFGSGPGISPFASLIFGRDSGSGSIQANGTFTFGTYVDTYASSLAQAVHLPVFSDTSDEDSSNGTSFPTWALTLDGLTVNGTQYTLNSSVPQVPSGKSLVILDSGYYSTIVSPDIVDFIYSNISGAAYFKEVDAWIIPCNMPANLSLTFGGQEYLMDPLDLTAIQYFRLTNGTEVTFCSNTFQSSSFRRGSGLPAADMILGLPFLRNVYTLLSYGNTVYNATTSEGPYVQFVSVTNATSASDFSSIRHRILANSPMELTPSEFIKTIRAESTNASSSSDNDRT